jgi:hypothetical protein
MLLATLEEYSIGTILSKVISMIYELIYELIPTIRI